MGNYPNLEVREFSQSIINFVNQSLLPDEIKYLVLSSITRDLEKASNTAINQEIAAREKEEKQHGDGGR